AEALLLQALDPVVGAEDAPWATAILIILSHVASDLGERDAAAERMQQALMRAREIEDHFRRARLLGSIAASSHGALSPAETEAVAFEALALGREFGDDTAIHEAMLGLGYI